MEGQENIQEILTKQLVLCQYACALSILMEGNVCVYVCTTIVYVVLIIVWSSFIEIFSFQTK